MVKKAMADNRRFPDKHLFELKRVNGRRVSSNQCSQPSKEGRLFTESDEARMDLLWNDDSSSEKKLKRDISKELLGGFSSRNGLLNFPVTYPLHNVIYNCKTTDSSPDDTRKPRCTLNRQDPKKLRTSVSCKISPLNQKSELPCNITKSQKKIWLKSSNVCIFQRNAPKMPLLDNNMIGSVPAKLCDNDECEFRSIVYDKTNSNCPLKKSKLYQTNKNICLDQEQVRTPLKNLKEFKIMITPDGKPKQVSSLINCSCENSSTENVGNICKNDKLGDKTNELSLKLDDNLFLNVITDGEKYSEDNIWSTLKCNRNLSSEDEKGEFPAFEILVKCNEEAVEKNSSPRMFTRNKCKVPDKQDDYQKWLPRNTCYKKTLEPSSPPKINPTGTCPAMLQRTNLKNECCEPCCKIPVSVEENNYSKCPVADEICCSPTVMKVELRKKNVLPLKPTKNIDTKVSNKNHSRKRKARTDEKISAKKTKHSASTKRNGLNQSQRSSAPAQVPFSSKTTNNLASLSSFSLFFIMDDMDTGNCGCNKSESDELLSTAMIYLHVNSSRKNRLPTICENTCNKLSPSCSCPSIVSSRNACLIKMKPTNRPVSSCPSIKKCGICGIKKTPTYIPEPLQQTTCSSADRCKLCSARICPKLQETSCLAQQMRFSATVPADKCKICSASICPKECPAVCSTRNILVRQQYIQACVLQKSVCVQSSEVCGAFLQQKSIQAAASQRSAAAQPSICRAPTCSAARSIPRNESSGIIYPPSCAVNLRPRLIDKAPCTLIKKSIIKQPSCSVKVGCEVCTAVKMSSCTALKEEYSCTPKVDPLSTHANSLQSKTGCLCIQSKSIENFKNMISEKSCLLSNECTLKTSSSCKKPFSIQSKPSCVICKQLAKLGECNLKAPSSSRKAFSIQSNPSCAICKQFAKLVPCHDVMANEEYAQKALSREGNPFVSTTSCDFCKHLEKLSSCVLDVEEKLQRRRKCSSNCFGLSDLTETKSFKLSHSYANEHFTYNEGTKEDLELITKDYSDLGKAFEKFIVTGIDPKCNNIRDD